MGFPLGGAVQRGYCANGERELTGTDEFCIGGRRRYQLRLFEATAPKNLMEFQVVKRHSVFARVRRVTRANGGRVGWIRMNSREDLRRDGFLRPFDEIFPSR